MKHHRLILAQLRRRLSNRTRDWGVSRSKWYVDPTVIQTLSIRIKASADRHEHYGSNRQNHSMLIKRRKRALTTLAAIATILTLTALPTFGGEPSIAQGQQSPQTSFTLVAFDTSLSELQDIEAAGLAAKMVLSDADEGLIIVGNYSDHAEEPQTFASADLAKENVDLAIDGMKTRLEQETETADLSEMIEKYAAFIDDLESIDNGRFYILSAGRFTFHESTGVGGLESLAADLAAIGVTVNTVSLATTPTADRDVLAAISSAGGGTAHDLGFLDGIVDFINQELDVALEPSLQSETASAGGETINIGVTPHSSYLVAGFSFDDPDTVNVIREPNGQEIADSVGSVNAFSISGLKFFTVRNPQPGFWALISSGGSGQLTVFSDVVNDLNIAIRQEPPFPEDEPFLLRVDARSGDVPFIDLSASIDAIVTDPNGGQHTYVLNDAGENGDVEAEDSVFSAMVDDIQLAGVYDADFSMRWPNVQSTIDGAGTFIVEPFPNIEISAAPQESFPQGTRSLLATIDLKLGESAFLASVDDVDVTVLDTSEGSSISTELEPAEVVDGKVYRLLVFGTLDNSGEYEFNATLKSSYLEREFTAVAISKTQELQVEPPVPLILYAGLGVVALIGLIFILLVLRTMFRSSPYGHLFRIDSAGEREVVANFREYRHSPWDWLMHKPIVPAAALPAVPLHGGRFVFASRGISFRYQPDTDGSLRVLVGGDQIQAGDTLIPDGEEFHIGSDKFVFDRAALTGDVRVSTRLAETQRRRNEELENFALDPMTWDAPPSARPTRRRR